MVQQTADIERIVREVLADLGLLAPEAGDPSTDAPKAAPVAPESAAPERPAPPPRPVGDVVVLERVVTLAGLGDRLAAAKRLVVPPRAVVTPAVRDELRRRNVALVVEECRPDGPSAGKVALTVLGSRTDPKPLVTELQRHGLNVEQQQFDCLIRATDDMARQLAVPGTAGVLLSNYGAIASCLANRHAKVRAVLASDESRTATDAVSIGANLLVVEPRRTAPETLLRIVTDFCQQGPGECPEELQDRLA